MRIVPLAALSFATLVLASCAGSSPGPEAPAPSAAPSASPPSLMSTVTDSPTPSGPPSATPSAAPADAPPPEPTRAAPTLDGTLLGKPFKPVAACLAAAGKDAGKAYIEIYDVKDFDVKTTCGMLPPKPGARKMGIVLPWTDGQKTDLASFKNTKEAELFVMATTGNPKKYDRKDAPKDFKPTGTVEVLRAAKKGGVGRIKFDLTAGKDKLAGEIDVEVIASPTP